MHRSFEVVGIAASGGVYGRDVWVGEMQLVIELGDRGFECSDFLLLLMVGSDRICYASFELIHDSVVIGS